MRDSRAKTVVAWSLIGGLIGAGGAGSVAWAEGAKKDKAPRGAAEAAPEGAAAAGAGAGAGADSGQAAAMAAMAKLSGPSEKHKVLAQLAGSWEAHSKAFMRPGQPPLESHGSAETRLILGGRFLQEDYSNTFGKAPFQGHGLTGYDLIKQKYVNVWVDNLGSWLTQSEGTLDASGKVLTLAGTMPDPQTGKGRPTKTITRIESADRHVFEIYDNVDGKDVKIMEVTYTRKK